MHCPVGVVGYCILQDSFQSGCCTGKPPEGKYSDQRDPRALVDLQLPDERDWQDREKNVGKDVEH